MWFVLYGGILGFDIGFKFKLMMMMMLLVYVNVVFLEREDEECVAVAGIRKKSRFFFFMNYGIFLINLFNKKNELRIFLFCFLNK